MNDPNTAISTMAVKIGRAYLFHIPKEALSFGDLVPTETEQTSVMHKIIGIVTMPPTTGDLATSRVRKNKGRQIVSMRVRNSNRYR